MSITFPTTYDLNISEEQRVALIDALKAANVGGTDDHALQYWVAMLEDLPNVEQKYVDPETGKTRNITNGFCL